MKETENCPICDDDLIPSPWLLNNPCVTVGKMAMLEIEMSLLLPMTKIRVSMDGGSTQPGDELPVEGLST